MNSTNSYGFVTLSTLVHSGLVFGLLMVPHLTPPPDGGGGSTTVEFESIGPLSNGSAANSTLPEEPATPSAPPQAEPEVRALPATEAVAEEPVALPPPQPIKAKPSPKKVAQKAVRKSTPQPLKFKNTTAVTELPAKDNLPEDIQPLDKTADDGFATAQAAAAAEQADDQWSKEDLAAAEVDATENTDKDNEEEVLAGTETRADTTPVPEAALTGAGSPASAPSQADQQGPSSPSSSGPATNAGEAGASGPPPSGPIRSYEDLRQVPGNVPPRYPPAARMQRQQGGIVLRYFVTGDGRVSQMSMIRSSGHPMLDQEAIAAVGRYKYVPGQAGWTMHPVNFSLKGPEEGAGGRLRTARK